MATIPALNLPELLKGIPRGAWVAIAADHGHVIAYGFDLTQVLDEAKKAGEQQPIVTRIAESAMALML